jgi:c-di-GMP-binding flagellar brake protein YcgR
MSALTRPAPLGDFDELDAYRIDHPAEVVALLRRLASTHALVQLSSPSGAAYTSVVWSVDAQARRIGLDANPAHPQVRGLVDDGEATAVAYLDAVKLQFDLRALLLAHGDGASTLQAALPERMYRFQRRSAYRVRAHDGACVEVSHPARPNERLTLRVIDISAGGCALALPAPLPPIEPGTLLSGAVFLLDHDTQFTAQVAVQHVSGGFDPQARHLRLGCAFSVLDGLAQRTLQRYIDLTQRRNAVR